MHLSNNQHDISNILVSLQSMAQLMKQGFYESDMADDLMERILSLKKLINVDSLNTVEDSVSNPTPKPLK
ncbi:MAG: hypothetical protein COW00_12080 [Bdellovibrio sp. CG12_big_fil_rev_8_21_14_0_65_39_13]|nr:MAG: hypothetical protein COW78_15150 [Bdellovibrio sp. CG22_combo_CG10-13_8_21_14_all_39_27]PIQ59116.1 MAG: hypothetical protein COW00_12080 [Bdellovibrio sp. CG12_big_fil_rev_8_21_14_0_65_39_13]PIR33683.1 MAG: hypothetical protein COV37_15475 [Bdellovibrio sp. CG11_big_fil_rev_8_21_14_0_20_39_38]PJB54377.1 MAG: hypothetical protein CO099_01940 [Bdellovibrio sp. CG_4_9_14_3_um_filter_39_7]